MRTGDSEAVELLAPTLVMDLSEVPYHALEHSQADIEKGSFVSCIGAIDK